MILLPYNLVDMKSSSTGYQDAVNELTDRIQLHAPLYLPSLLEENRDRQADSSIVLDALLFGVLWCEYAAWATNVPAIDLNLVAKLSRIRSQFPESKRSIDQARADSFAGFLEVRPSLDHPTPLVTASTLECFLLFLEALGEYERTVDRLRAFSLERLTGGLHIFKREMSEILCFAEWFKVEAAALLQPFTCDCDQYLDHVEKQTRHDAESILRRHTPAEYHVNMVCAEILRREQEPAFKNSAKKMVVVPRCLCSDPEGCGAKQDGELFTCTHCNDECPLNQISSICDRYNAELITLAHSSGFSSWIDSPDRVANTGIIGVACVANLVEGGLEAQNRRIPVSCIPLDHPGCCHWHEKYEGSQMNLEALEELLDSKQHATRCLEPVLPL